MSGDKNKKIQTSIFFLLFFSVLIGTGFLTGKIFNETFLKANIARYGSASVEKTFDSGQMENVALVQTPLPQQTQRVVSPYPPANTPSLPPLFPTQQTQEKFFNNPENARIVPYENVNCTYTESKKTNFSGKFVSLTKPIILNPGEIAEMKILIRNTGNTPWFSSESGCGNVPTVYLGTEQQRDRVSPFFLDASQKSNWIGTNRIKMQNKRVDPFQIASFSFLIKAPQEPGIYREFYAPVIEGKTWIEAEALVHVDLRVGQTSDLDSPYLPFISESTNLSKLDLTGEKNIEVSLSEQTMWLKLGEKVIRTFPVSTGSYKTPTPRGNYHILSKQKVRVAGKAPHYIMPLFMMFKNGGYGIHALPSLGNDRGVFWREALNHIGSPRSHGCVRLLPDDAQFVWDFADVGTAMVVKR